MRRLLLLTMLALSCAWVSLLGFTGAPASAACDPTPGPLAGDLRQAGVVFTGKLSSVHKGAAGAPTTYTVAAQRVYRGRIESEVTVLTPATAADCGLKGVNVGESWLFVGTSSPAGVLVESDEGSRPTTASVTRQVRQQLGVGRNPIPVESSDDPLEVNLTRVADDGPTRFWPLAMPGAAVAIAGLVVLAAARAIGRPKESRA
jgi:hypothetical protein